MSEPNQKMIFHVKTARIDAHGSLAQCKSADITLDTDLAGRADAFNPPNCCWLPCLPASSRASSASRPC